MNIYLDESGDSANGRIHVMGALFCPSSRSIHRAIRDTKIKNKYVDDNGICREIKYSKCRSHKIYKTARDMVDDFAKSKCWFRAIVLKKSDINYSYFGGRQEPLKLKKARAYKKWGEILLSSNTKSISNAVLLADQLVMCAGDQFVEKMEESFCYPGKGKCIGREKPIFKTITKIDTSQEQYQVGQLCDILTGVIVNEHFPTKNDYKNKLRRYVLRKLKVTTFLNGYWDNREKWWTESNHFKYNVFYCIPGSQ